MELTQELLRRIENNQVVEVELSLVAMKQLPELRRLLKVLITNISVKRLIFKGDIQSSGASLGILRILETNSTIVDLNLSGEIYDDMLRIVAKSLKDNKTLNHLTIHCNHASSDEIFHSFADFVRDNPNLITFKLENAILVSRASLERLFSDVVKEDLNKNLLQCSYVNSDAMRVLDSHKGWAKRYICEIKDIESIYANVKDDDGNLNAEILADIYSRLLAIRYVAKHDMKMSEQQVEEMLAEVIDLIEKKGIGQVKAINPPIDQDFTLAQPTTEITELINPSKPKISPAEIRAQLLRRRGVTLGLVDLSNGVER